VGILFAQWGTRLIVSLFSTGQYRLFLDLCVDSRVLAFTSCMAILTGVLFGLAPAWRGIRVNAQMAMKANARGVIEGGRFGLGKALVVAQVALSLVLLVGAGLMLSTFFRLETLDPGFVRDHVLLVNVDLRNQHSPMARRVLIFEEMLRNLRELSGVSAVSASAETPIGGGVWNQTLQIEGYTSER
jgi:hypothetical protein